MDSNNIGIHIGIATGCIQHIDITLLGRLVSVVIVTANVGEFVACFV